MNEELLRRLYEQYYNNQPQQGFDTRLLSSSDKVDAIAQQGVQGQQMSQQNAALQNQQMVQQSAAAMQAAQQQQAQQEKQQQQMIMQLAKMFMEAGE